MDRRKFMIFTGSAIFVPNHASAQEPSTTALVLIEIGKIIGAFIAGKVLANAFPGDSEKRIREFITMTIDDAKAYIHTDIRVAFQDYAFNQMKANYQSCIDELIAFSRLPYDKRRENIWRMQSVYLKSGELKRFSEQYDEAGLAITVAALQIRFGAIIALFQNDNIRAGPSTFYDVEFLPSFSLISSKLDNIETRFDPDYRVGTEGCEREGGSASLWKCRYLQDGSGRTFVIHTEDYSDAMKQINFWSSKARESLEAEYDSVYDNYISPLRITMSALKGVAATTAHGIPGP